MAFNEKVYKDHYRRVLFNEAERDQFYKEFDKAVSLEDERKVNILLQVLRKEGRTKLLSTYRGHEGETFLHIAAKFNKSSDIIKILVQNCPELMTTARKESTDYYGQTALHVAIAKGNLEAVEIMLSEVYNQSQSLRTALLHTLATGVKFANTIMMGELPLSVAALSFNDKIMDKLLKNGAEMERQNTKGDTVFHSLIRFAAIYPEHTSDVIDTMSFLHDKITQKQQSADFVLDFDHSDYGYIWFIPNHEDLNPLQLAATLSQDNIFNFIFKLPKVYCYLNSHDGLFDRQSYDITEIDTLATERWAEDQSRRRNRLQRHVAPTMAEGVSRHKFSNKTNDSCFPIDNPKRVKRKSVLEMMFDIKSSVAFQFIQQPVVRQVIKTKWLRYRYYYYFWMALHFLFMTALTFYAVYKAEDYKLNDNNNTMSTDKEASGKTRNDFLYAFKIIYFIIGVFLFLHQILHLVFRVKSYKLVQLCNILHNGVYRMILALFSISLILEFGLSYTETYENYMLIVALITGWWFCVFFLRAIKKFSFFTVMIQKIIFGDMIRFSLIIMLMLIAFSAAMFMTFKGSETENKDLWTYWHTMMLLFKLMLGLGDIEDLYEARRPWLAVTLFIVFVVLTYVLMLNALIAMMSQTCSIVSDNRNVQWRVQQLSVILFFEGILPPCMTKTVGEEKHVKRYDPSMKQVVEEKRYFLDMSSLQTEYASAEDIRSMKKMVQTMPFGDNQGGSDYFNPYMNITMQTQNYMKSPRYNFYGSRTPYFESHLVPPRSPNPSQIEPPIQIKLNTPKHASPGGSNDREPDYQASPNIKRRKSKREKQVDNYDQADNMADPDNSPDSRKRKRRIGKKRVDPEGDINTSYDDQNRFYLNTEHLTAPGPSNTPLPVKPAGERRRYNSEGGLIDTHIGNPMQQRYPIYRVQPQSEIPNQNSVEIGVIADSYM